MVKTIMMTTLLGGISFALPAIAVSQSPAFKISLEQDLVIGEESGVSFGSSLKVAVNSKGMIYVGDWQNANITVFAPDGRLVETIGRQGQGPGEFGAIHQVVVGRGDSLYVLDLNLYRISVFSPGSQHALANTFRLASRGAQGNPSQLLVPSAPAGKLLMSFNQPTTNSIAVYQLDKDGMVFTQPTIQWNKSSEVATKVGRPEGGGVAVSRTSPLFGRKTMIGLTPKDELYYNWSEAIDLAFHDLTGKWVKTFRANSPSIPVTSRDIEYELRDADELRRNILEGITPPKTKPAVHTIIIDDRYWIWTGRYTADPARSEWWVTRDAGDGDSAVLTLPSNVNIRKVRNGFAYAVVTDEDDLPSVVCYRILTERSINQQ